MEFTQFLRPHGRRKQINITMSAKVELLADKCVEAGVRFEAEVLTTNQISFTAELDDEDGEVDVLGHEICHNEPGKTIPEAVEKVVRTAAERIDGETT